MFFEKQFSPSICKYYMANIKKVMKYMPSIFSKVFKMYFKCFLIGYVCISIEIQ